MSQTPVPQNSNPATIELKEYNGKAARGVRPFQGIEVKQKENSWNIPVLRFVGFVGGFLMFAGLFSQNSDKNVMALMGAMLLSLGFQIFNPEESNVFIAFFLGLIICGLALIAESFLLVTPLGAVAVLLAFVMMIALPWYQFSPKKQ